MTECEEVAAAMPLPANARALSLNELRAFARTQMHYGESEQVIDNVAWALRERARAPLPRRMWVNQPSALQQYHALHGTNVLAVREDAATCRIYFLSGPIVSQQIDPLALSEGWIE